MLSVGYKFLDNLAILYRPAEALGLFLSIEFSNCQSTLGFKACIIIDEPFQRAYSDVCITTQQLRLSIYALLRRISSTMTECDVLRHSFVDLPSGFVEESIRRKRIIGSEAHGPDAQSAVVQQVYSRYMGAASAKACSSQSL